MSTLFGKFFPQFLRASPAGFGEPGIPTLVGPCHPPCLGGGAQTPRLPTFRAIASCSGGHRIPLESSPFDGLIVSWSVALVNTFLSFFTRSLLALGSSPAGRSAHNHSGVPLLGSRGRPSEGLGFASPPDTIIIPQPGANVNTFFEKILRNFFAERG